MTERADLIAAAAPPCHECGWPVQRIEMRWLMQDVDGERGWVPGPTFMVCTEGHRVRVEPFA